MLTEYSRAAATAPLSICRAQLARGCKQRPLSPVSIWHGLAHCCLACLGWLFGLWEVIWAQSGTKDYGAGWLCCAADMRQWALHQACTTAAPWAAGAWACQVRQRGAGGAGAWARQVRQRGMGGAGGSSNRHINTACAALMHMHSNPLCTTLQVQHARRCTHPWGPLGSLTLISHAVVLTPSRLFLGGGDAARAQAGAAAREGAGACLPALCAPSHAPP